MKLFQNLIVYYTVSSVWTAPMFDILKDKIYLKSKINSHKYVDVETAKRSHSNGVRTSNDIHKNADLSPGIEGTGSKESIAKLFTSYADLLQLLQNSQQTLTTIIENLGTIFPNIDFPTLESYFTVDINDIISVNEFLDEIPAYETIFEADPNGAVQAALDPTQTLIPILVNENPEPGDPVTISLRKPEFYSRIVNFLG